MLKSNGLRHSKNLPVKFGFSPRTVPANIAKKLPSQRCSQPLFNFAHKWPTFAFTGESGYTLVFRRKIAHSGSHALTGAFPLPATAWLCAASEIHFIPPCFYIHTFPGSLWTTTISNSSISDHLSSRFSTSRTNGLRLLSQAKVGTHSAFRERSHTRAHTAKQGAFRTGALLLPSERSTRFGNPAWPGVRTANFAAFRPWSGALPENAESLRNSDALMCVAVSRRRGPAGLRDFFAFVEVAACTPYSRNFFQFSRRSSLCCSCASCVSARSFSARS